MDVKIFLLLFLIKFSTGKLFVRSFKTCGKPLIGIDVTIKTIDNSYQELNATYSSKIINGENMESNLKVFILIGTKWTQVVKLIEKRGVCVQMDRYIGPLFYDILRSAGVMAKCPVLPGTYHLTNYRPSFNLMKLQLPPGRIKLNLEVIEKATKKLAMCFDAEFENTP